jgi:prolyl oligopeptidase
MMKNWILLLFVLALCAGCKQQIKMKAYPETRQDLSVLDNYFGTEVADPYRWLEDDRSEETAAWVAAQNAVTSDYLARIPFRGQIRSRLSQLYDYPKIGAPSRQGDWYYSMRNDGLQNQGVLCRQRSLDEEPEVFFDPNTLSADGTAALGTFTFSLDFKYMAYTVSRSGSDWVEIFVMDVETGEKLADRIRWVKFSEAVWADGGFYYSRYDAPAEGSLHAGLNEYQKVYFHRLGTDQSEDTLIYEDPAHPLRYFTATPSEDERYLFIVASEGTSGSEILYRRMDDTGPFRVLFEGFEHDYTIVRCTGGSLLLRTNDGAENFRLAEVDLSAARPVLKDLIAEQGDLLNSVTPGGGYLFANYLKDASTCIDQYDLQGNRIRRIELPAIGTAAGFEGTDTQTPLFYTFSSFNVPPTVFAYDPATGTSEVLIETEVPFDPADFTVEQVFYPSRDGTRVPMFLVYKKGMERNGQNPVHLYAYGGFNISYGPAFSPALVMFMEQGGIYALANIRGGSEYGEAWHRAGMLERKQNVFDDFIAAAEYLIAERYTSTSRLAISGGSNGGLLIGAVMTQRPELFGVCFPLVGVLDMLRYHKFTIGWGWAVEYGSSDDAAQFEYIYKYSPLHNLRPGTCYPATMVTTADHDDRVVPGHSFKFAAELQHSQGCGAPVLIRIDTNAGHGAGKPTSKRIDEAADVYSFVFENTGTKVKF